MRIVGLMVVLGVAFAGWFWKNSIVPATDGNVGQARKVTVSKLGPRYVTGHTSHYDLAISPDGSIWSVGYDGENYGLVSRLDVGTKSWQRTKYTNRFAMPEAIAFPSASTGVIVARSQFFNTMDGGQNWQRFELRSYLTPVAIDFWNEEIGVVVGRHNVSNEQRMEVWRTDDGGRSFAKFAELRSDRFPYDVIFLSSSEIIMVVAKDELMRSRDGGKTWSPERFELFSVSSAVRKSDSQTLLLGTEGEVATSDNVNGWTMTSLISRTANSLVWRDIACIGGSVIVAVGDKGSLAVSFTGGVEWADVQSGIGEDLVRIYSGPDFFVILGTDSMFRLDLE